MAPSWAATWAARMNLVRDAGCNAVGDLGEGLERLWRVQQRVLRPELAGLSPLLGVVVKAGRFQQSIELAVERSDDGWRRLDERGCCVGTPVLRDEIRRKSPWLDAVSVVVDSLVMWRVRAFNAPLDLGPACAQRQRTQLAQQFYQPCADRLDDLEHRRRRSPRPLRTWQVPGRDPALHRASTP